MARGGPRTPARPAAVSGPGAHSQRTDGGPSGTANLAAPGGSYGARQQLEAEQSAAPVPVGRAAGANPAGSPVGVGSGQAGGSAGAFGPTQRPGEPITAGVMPQRLGQDPNVDMALRAAYALFPTPYVGRMLRRR